MKKRGNRERKLEQKATRVEEEQERKGSNLNYWFSSSRG
jgi:hypothetical protein